MPTDTPPTIDPVAAARWQRAAPAHSPWLHEEVARRMESRLQWMRQAPATWCHWDPVRGGLQAHALLRQRYPGADCYVTETAPTRQAHAAAALAPSWWSTARWTGGATRLAPPPPGSVQMLWANMAL
ncbi:MAG: biotin synthase, partial [Giesbergeria sp.]|nr:biotin synthase [Giesbergeria sp.]